MHQFAGGNVLPFQVDSFERISHARTLWSDDQLVGDMQLLHDIEP